MSGLGRRKDRDRTQQLNRVGGGGRVVDFGGEAIDDEVSEDYDGPVMVIFAIDPGVATGWTGLKVPLGLIPTLGVSRTLVRCRHRHGTLRRSGVQPVGAAGGAWSSTDSQHVTDLLDTARGIYTDWMPDEEDDDEEHDRFRFIFVMEGFDLRINNMDPDLLAPVRVASVFMDRLMMGQSAMRVSFQKVSDAKKTVTDDRLRRWGMYDPSSGTHARDSDRHAILFLRRFAMSRDLRTSLWGYDPIRIRSDQISLSL